jgi:diacylglycerol kinase
MIRKRIQSFSHAFNGIFHLFKNETHAQIELGMAILANAFAFYLDLPSDEWLWIIVSCIVVLAAEAFNTAIEVLLNHLHPDLHPAVGLAKDISAAAVLLCSIGALIVGLIIFLPHLRLIFSN